MCALCCVLEVVLRHVTQNESTDGDVREIVVATACRTEVCSAGALCVASVRGNAFDSMDHIHDHCESCGSCVGSGCFVSDVDGPAGAGRAGTSSADAGAAGAKNLCAACFRNHPGDRALEFLNDVGAVLYFPDDPRLASFVALSPQVLIDAMRALIGDPSLPGWVAQFPAESAGEYLVDGVLTKAALLEAWLPKLGSADRVAYVYRVMQRFDLFLPLSQDGMTLSAVPLRTLVPSMLSIAEPGGGEAWFWETLCANGHNARAARFAFSLLTPVLAAETPDSVHPVPRGQVLPQPTLHGLLHAFVVRIAGTTHAWTAAAPENATESVWQSEYWASGWRGIHRQYGVRARVCLVGQLVEIRVVGGHDGAAAGTMALLARILRELVVAGWPGVRIDSAWKCLCAAACACWVPAHDVTVARDMRGVHHRCACQHAPLVPLAWLSDEPSGASAPPRTAGVVAVPPRIAFLCSSPILWNGVVVQRIDYKRDLQQVSHALRLANKSVDVDIAFATVNEFIRSVSLHPAVLHFCGHGRGGGDVRPCLVLEADGEGLFAYAAGLRELFTAYPPDSVVFLAACDSELVGSAVVDAGVRHVIASMRRIHDVAASDFTSAFYCALFAGKSVTVAFDMASVACVTLGHGDADSIGFVLLPAGGDHSFVPFPSLASGLREFPALPCAAVPTMLVGDVFGREADTAAIVALLMRDKCRSVCISGPPECGKSAVAIAVANYLTVRRAFEIVLWVDLAPAFDASSMLFQIASQIAIQLRVCTRLEGLDGVLTSVGSRHALLVLDNCDDALAATERTAMTLLSKCASVSIIITARNPVSTCCVPRAKRSIPRLPVHALWSLFALGVSTLVLEAEIAHLRTDREEDSIGLINVALARAGFDSNVGDLLRWAEQHTTGVSLQELLSSAAARSGVPYDGVIAARQAHAARAEEARAALKAEMQAALGGSGSGGGGGGGGGGSAAAARPL